MATLPRSTRKSLPLSERDLVDLATLRSSEQYREALSRLGGQQVTAATSEAVVLHAVWQAGLKAVREQLEADGYAELARDRHEESARQVARRRRPAWADE